MVALCACRGHDRSIGNGRAVIAAHRARHAGGNGDNHKLRIGIFKYRHHDGDEDAEGSPGGPRRERQAAAHQEDDGRQQLHQSARRTLHGRGNVIRRSQAVRHGLQRPCEGENQDGRHHGLEALGQAVHGLLEAQHPADHVKYNGDHDAKEASQRQSHGRVAVGKRSHEVCTLKEAAGVNHTDHAADDQGENRHQHVDHSSPRVLRHVLSAGVHRTPGGEDVSLLRVGLMLCHGAELEAHEHHGDHHDNGQKRVEIVRDGPHEDA